jgi:hypothetical protein
MFLVLDAAESKVPDGVTGPILRSETGLRLNRNTSYLFHTTNPRSLGVDVRQRRSILTANVYQPF